MGEERRKRLKASGEEHVDSEGRTVEKRTVKAITCRCGKECRRKVSSEEAERICKAFYETGSYQQQNIYLVVKSKALWINYGEGEEVIDGKKTTVKHPGVIWLRFSYSEDEPWRKVNITKRASDIPTPITEEVPRWESD